MPWKGLQGHENVIARFQKSVDRGRLASTYLFVGPRGTGKHTFALKLAQSLLCANRSNEALHACGTCPDCIQVDAKNHPDLILVAKPVDKAFIPVETFIGDREHRRQQGLCHDIGLKPFRGGRKIAIIDDADFLNQEGANCLLKTLEEPPPRSLLILIGTSEQQQLSTIVSRSQVVRFNSLSVEQVEEILRAKDDLETSIPLDELAAASGGSVELALKLAEPETFEFRKQLLEYLSRSDPNYEVFAKSVGAFVDAAGKDSATKRGRLNDVADFAITYFRQCYLAVTETTKNSGEIDSWLAKQAESAAGAWRPDRVAEGAQVFALSIHRCTALQQQVAANVNQTTAIEAWLCDLSRLGRGMTLAVG